MKNIYHDGFTIIELLVVIAIIGILVGFSAINLSGVRQRGRDGQRKADLRSIQSALELYRADNRTYPPSLPGCGAPGAAFVPLTDASNRMYLQNIPCDPVSPYDPYLYTYNSPTAGSYTLRACLENPSDVNRDDDDNVGLDSCPAQNRVSYTVANP